MGRAFTEPSNRLVSAASLAADFFHGKSGLSAVDVGCDHAKLSVYLVQSGLCNAVTATDVADGPLEKARLTVESRTMKGAPLTNYITLHKGDGLDGLAEINADMVFILGMGGETVAHILDKGKPFRQKHPQALYVLQAMTSETELRNYLYAHGFSIHKEILTTDKGRTYSLMACEETGNVFVGDYLDGYVGYYRRHAKPDALGYLNRKYRILQKLTADKENAGIRCPIEKAALQELREIIDNLKGAVPHDT